MWPDFSIDWRFGGSMYRISVGTSKRRLGGSPLATLDGAAVDHTAIPLVDDGEVHEVTFATSGRRLRQVASECAYQYQADRSVANRMRTCR